MILIGMSDIQLGSWNISSGGGQKSNGRDFAQEISKFYDTPVKNFDGLYNTSWTDAHSYFECLTADLSRYGGQLDPSRGTVSMRVEIDAKAQTTQMPTEAEYKELQKFLSKEMDRVMLEIAEEYKDIMALATKIRSCEELTQEEKELKESREDDLYELMSIMGHYSVRGFREGVYKLDAKDAELYASLYNTGYSNSMDLEQKDGIHFFGFVSYKLTSEQREAIIDAAAKIRVYDEQNGFQISNAFFKRNAGTGKMEFTLLESNSLPRLDTLISLNPNFNSKFLLEEMLEKKDKQEVRNTTDSIMQTLLKDAKDSKENPKA